MPLALAMTACLVSLLIGGRCAAHEEPPTVEIKSIELRVLEGVEKDRFLAAHNAARKAVGVQPLAWSNQLGQVALESLQEQQAELIEAARQGWADRQVVLPDHRTDDKYGENIAGWAGSNGASAERAVAWWLSEKAALDKLNGDNSYKCHRAD